MPAQYLHILGALKAFNRVSGGTFPLDYKAFFAGAQGPDIFYHNQRTRPLAVSLGSLLHRRDYGFFSSGAIDYVLSECAFPHNGDSNTGKIESSSINLSRNFLISYLAGFLSHGILDRVFHPFIIYASFFPDNKHSPVPPGRFHPFFERILDFIFMDEFSSGIFSDSGFQETSGRIVDLDVDSFLNFSPVELGLLEDFFYEVFRNVYPEKTLSDANLRLRLKNSFSDSLWFYYVTNPFYSDLSKSSEVFKSRYKEEINWTLVSLIHPQSLISGVDWFNSQKKVWLNPSTGEESDSSLYDLFDRAVKGIEIIYKAFFDFVSGRVPPEKENLKDFAFLIGNTSLSLSDSQGKPGVPVFFKSDFYPLDVEFMHQVDLRYYWWNET